MRTIEYVEAPEKGTTLLKVKVDGKVVPEAFFDTKLIRNLVRARKLNPQQIQSILSDLRKKVVDNGPRLDVAELNQIVKRFEEEFHR
jgi:hypothetical protein